MNTLPNLLIVDDNLVNLTYLKIILSDLDVNLILSESGYDALERTQDLELALAILDIQMPIMDGFELALKINEERGNNKVPIIFVTANHINELDVFQGYGSGAVDYIFKPVNNSILLSKVNVFLDLFNNKQTIIREALLLEKNAEKLIWLNAALKTSEEKYRSYIDNAPDGVFVTNEKGKFFEVNPAACQITGYSKEDLLEMWISDILPEESVKPELDHFDNMLKTGSLKTNLSFKHKSGIKRWLALDGVSLSQNRFLFFTKDITAKMELEEALRAHQIELEMQYDEVKLARKLAEIVSHKYTELYDFAPSGYFTLSVDKKIKELNHSGATMISKERLSLIGSHFGYFISKDTLPVFNAFFLKIIETKAKQTCEVIIHVTDNHLINVHIEGIFDTNNEQCLLNVVDITERKLTENLLKESESTLKKISTRLALATRAGGVGVWEMNIETNELIWDEHMFLLYGLDKKDLKLGYATWLAGIHPEDKARIILEHQLAIDGKQEFDTEFRVCWPDGTIHNIRAIAIVVRDSNGKPRQMIGTNWDITEQKLLEQKLKSSETNFRSFFENLSDMVVVGNMQGEIIYANNTLCNAIGYTKSELQEMYVLDLNPAEMRAEAEQIFVEMIAGKRESCPLPLIRKNGSKIPVETRVRLGKWNNRDCIFGYIKNLSVEQEALQKFNKIFQSNPALIAISTIPEGIFTDVNDTFLAKTGYSKEEIIGKTTLEVGLFIESEKQRNAAVLLSDTGRMHNMELEVVTKSGEILDGLFSGEIIESQGNKYFLTFMVDITERKLAEDILRNSEANLAEAQRIAQMGSFEWDMKTNLVKWSKEMYHVFDIEPDNYDGKPESILRIVHPDDLELFRNSMNNNLEKGNSTSLEYRVIHRDGSIHNLYAEGRIKFDNHGNPVRNIGTVQDITERKKNEQELKISEEKYRTMLNASPDGILLIDLRKIITEVSEIGLELFDADSRDDLVGKDFYQFIPLDERNKIIDIFEKTVSEGLVQNVELKIRKKSQSTFFSEISSTLIQAPDGEPLSFMIIIRDISQRKKIETKQIHADRMANLGEMASGIAHEINQPLNIISMVMDKILFETDKTDTIDIEFLKNKSDKIFDNITRIRNIIDHVRAFSRNDDNYILTAFDINSSIENATSMILEQFKHLGINLYLQLDKNIPQLVGNTYKFEQVIVNLLTNAKDAVIEKKTKQDESENMFVEIKTYRENQSLIIEITDNGIGIDNDDIHNIMLPFYTTKEEGKGTGLGLSICYQIIKEMNGTIDIISDGMNGTKIRLVLELQKTNKDG